MAYRRTRSTRRTSRRSYRPVRRKVWVRATQSSTVGVVANYGFNLIGSGMLDPGARIGSTVVRTILTVEFIAGALVLPGANGFFAGLAVANTVGFTVGGTPPILPVTHANSVDWMHWSYNAVAQVGTGVLTGTADTHIGKVFDIKSRRVMSQPDENLIFVVQNNGIANTTGVNITSQVLLLLA